MTIIEELIQNGDITDPKSPRGKLLAQAAYLFNERGYERTTVRDIANAVGIQSGSIFHHFKTKEDILKAVVTDAIVLSTAKMKNALTKAHSAEEKILALIRCELEAVNGLTGLAMGILVYEWRALSATNQDSILALRDIYEGYWLDALNQGISEGIVRGDAFIIRRLLQGALSWTSRWFRQDGSLSIEDLSIIALRQVLIKQEI